MFKHHSRYEGQKSGSSREIKDNEHTNRRHQVNDEAYDNESESMKSDGTFISNQDPTVPAIQMNEDSMDQGRSQGVRN